MLAPYEKLGVGEASTSHYPRLPHYETPLTDSSFFLCHQHEVFKSEDALL